jgi:hypothetical protein
VAGGRAALSYRSALEQIAATIITGIPELRSKLETT